MAFTRTDVRRVGRCARRHAHGCILVSVAGLALVACGARIEQAELEREAAKRLSADEPGTYEVQCQDGVGASSGSIALCTATRNGADADAGAARPVRVRIGGSKDGTADFAVEFIEPETEVSTTPAPADPTGGTIGTAARSMHAAGSSLDTTKFRPHGVKVGAARGPCTVIDPDPIREELARAIERDDAEATSVDVEDRNVLAADCNGRLHVLVAWTVGGSMRLDEYHGTGDGRWAPSAAGVDPGCTLPVDVVRLWDIDVSYCR